MDFSISRAYSEAGQMVRERFGPLLAIMALFFVAMIAIMVVFGMGTVATFAGMASGASDPAALGAGMIATYALLYLVVYLISLASMAALVTMASPTHRPEVGNAIVDGIKSAPSLFAVLIIAGIGFAVAAFALSLLAAVDQSGAIGVLVLLAIVGLGCWIFTKLSLVLPLIAVDGVRNPITAMSRSWKQTAGNALKVFLAWFVFWALAIALLMVVVFAVAGSVAGVTSMGEMPGVGTIVLLFVLYLVFIVAINLLTAALAATIHAQLAGPSEAYAETFE